jgi:predicted CoA-substrate-specific enzyme activase
MATPRIALGIDVGAVSVKLAACVPTSLADPIIHSNGHARSWRGLRIPKDERTALLVARPRRTQGMPAVAIRELLAEFNARIGEYVIAATVITGTSGAHDNVFPNARRCNGFRALVRAVDALLPLARTVFEIGGETSKYVRVAADDACARLRIVDYGTNGDCAAGTGSFLDQQAGRLGYAIEKLGDIVAEARRAAQIAGRCSVFAKSDMIHAQQKGLTPPEVLRGLCDAVAVNYRSAVVKGRCVEAPVALVGGVAANSAVVQALREAFDLDAEQLVVPPAADAFGAIGAALLALDDEAPAGESTGTSLRVVGNPNGADAEFAASPPLRVNRVRNLRDAIPPYQWPQNGTTMDAYLGLDIGSVGTKLVVIDADGEIAHQVFTRTAGRPIEVVTRHLREIEAAVGHRLRICGVGTTGSGRELVGELIGADSIHDEITAHKTGAAFVGERLLGVQPDTIFEIGGQDSKYIRLARDPVRGDSVVVDFTMNEACAAGTGSFLEERAEELGVAIKGEFSERALASRAPVKLGERCTVFMERDVNACMQRGARTDDIIAGLAYSVALNYINRVVRGRSIGERIFFQGGTANNDAVAAAFSMICDREIIIPPYNAVLGALGAALLAREKFAESGGATRFRGWDLAQVDYSLREFTCQGCGNRCSVQQFTVDGEKTYWGDKCSDRFRKRSKSPKQPVIPDLIGLRAELLAPDAPAPGGSTRGSVGIPLAMYTLGLLPLWRRFFADCGFEVVVSEETNRATVERGLDTVVAEPCFPIVVAHGHAAQLVERGVDYLWIPNIVSMESPVSDNQAYVCPWGQTLPFVLRQSPIFRAWPGRILCPTLWMRDGLEHIAAPLISLAGELGVARKTAQRAFAVALADQRRFEATYRAAGADALRTLASGGEDGMVLVGRPYNIHDAGANLAVARKLRDLYGVNVIPIDALPLDGIDVSDVNANMFWEYGRRILAAGKLVAEHPHLHLIYITNFKCGPDSFVKSFLTDAAGKPFLTLQFDGHSNDAGMMTRCEAYLDSKGILRWWRKPETDRTAQENPNDLPGDVSTSPRCPVLALD